MVSGELVSSPPVYLLTYPRHLQKAKGKKHKAKNHHTMVRASLHPMRLTDIVSADTTAFDHQLQSKLGSTSDNVRHLFRESACALSQELKDIRTTASCDDEEVVAHWIPGRIEVMGKHTDMLVEIR